MRRIIQYILWTKYKNIPNHELVLILIGNTNGILVGNTAEYCGWFRNPAPLGRWFVTLKLVGNTVDGSEILQQLVGGL